jgi:hypothetical protein
MDARVTSAVTRVFDALPAHDGRLVYRFNHRNLL